MRKLAAVAIAGSLQEAGDRRFAFMRLPPGQWRSARTTPSNVCMRVQATDQDAARLLEERRHANDYQWHTEYLR